MTISISNLTVNNNASAGTVVGVLTARDASGTVIPCTFTLTKNSAGFLAISGNSLVTAFSGSFSAGTYSVRVHATGTNTSFSGNAEFNVRVNIAAPPPLTPPPPPPPYSPDGTAITAPNGTLTTPQGTWTFGTTLLDAFDYATQLNGTANGAAVTLQITNRNVYAFNKGYGDWYLWSGTAWSNIGRQDAV